MDFKNRIFEISQHILFIGQVHRMIMVGILPAIVFLFVAVHAFLASDKGGCRPPLHVLWLWGDISRFKKVERYREDYNDGCNYAGDLPAFHVYTFLA